MANLYINDGKSDVSVGELGIILGKQQVILGNFERDFILRTAGNIKVQVGNKMYDLPFTTSTSTNTTTAVTATTSVIALESDLATLTYPGDGSFVYVVADKAFYIADNGTYVLLSKPADPTTAKLFLAYDSTQVLTGEQKLQVVLNTGSYIDSISNISSYGTGDVYKGQLVYAIAEAQHYKLIDPSNPAVTASWVPIYLSLKGGLLTGNLTIDPASGIQALTGLHITGSYLSTSLKPLTTVEPILSIGANDLSTGVAIWTNGGNTYIQNLVKNSSKGIDFLTTLSDGTVSNPLSISRNSVAIGGAINYSYALAITGSSFTANTAVFDSTVKSTNYIAGPAGTGFSLYKDGIATYTLEVDHLIVRDSTGVAGGTYATSGLPGSTILDYMITVQSSELVETFPLYIKATVSGRYLDTSGTPRLLSSRARNVKVVHTAVADLDLIGSLTPPTQVYESIRLSYAIGDIFDDTTSDTTTTYNQKADLTYYTPAGDTSYDSGTTSFIPDVSGTLLQINQISVYYVQSTSQANVALGDLLYFKQWNDTKTFASAVHAEVVLLVSGGYYIYAYDGINVVPGTQFIKVGNISGAGGMIQLNASDLTTPFIELLSGVDSFRDFYENYYFEQATDFVTADDLIEDSWTLQAHTRVKIGDLSNIVDTDLMLSTTEYGLYSDSAYIKGNFVLNEAKFTNVPLITGTSYDPFVMIASGRLEQIDMSGKITYWNAKADDTITITATGNGITGGGDLTANRTISLDFTYLDSRYSGGSGAVYYALEIPTGAIDGSNTIFTLAHTPVGSSEMVFLNGLVQLRTTDYTMSGSTITFTTAPFSSDSINVTYQS